MKKKYIKIAVIIIGFWCLFICTDYILAKLDKTPFFCIPVNVYKDGGTTEYYGLGYKVKKYRQNPVLYDPARKDAVFKLWGFDF